MESSYYKEFAITHCIKCRDYVTSDSGKRRLVVNFITSSRRVGFCWQYVAEILNRKTLKFNSIFHFSSTLGQFDQYLNTFGHDLYIWVLYSYSYLKEKYC